MCECGMEPAQREAYLKRFTVPEKEWKSMEVANKFLQEARECEAKWMKTGVLDGLSDKDRLTTSVLLEGQRLINELPDGPVPREFLDNAARIMAGQWIASPLATTGPERSVFRFVKRPTQTDWGALQEEIDFVLKQVENGEVEVRDAQAAWMEMPRQPAGSTYWDKRYPDSAHRQRFYAAANILLDRGCIEKGVKRAGI